MDLQSILKALTNARGFTYKAIGQLLGGVSAQSVSARLNKPNSMSVGTLLKYLDILNCELVIRDKKDKNDLWIITKSIKGDD